MKRLRRLLPAAAHFTAYVQLQSLDPARHRDRSYVIMWQPALIGQGALVRTWGRTGKTAQTKIDYYPDRASAQAQVEALLSRRLGVYAQNPDFFVSPLRA